MNPNQEGRMTLNIITPTGEHDPRQVAFVVLPGADGYLGILPRHTPLVTALKPGVVISQEEGGPFGEPAERHYFAISGGFAEVAENVVTVLADTAELSEQIDVQRARDALRRARQRLQQPEEETDVLRARVAVERAMARLQAAEQHDPRRGNE